MTLEYRSMCIGDLMATVTDPHGSQLSVRVDRSADNGRQCIEFTPRVEGMVTT